MKERPILFSAPMVRAILDGSKTQTRRIVGGHSIRQPGVFIGLTGPDAEQINFDTESAEWYCDGGFWHKRCPYGQPGDRLWVRETFTATRDREAILYRADPFYADMPRGDLGRDWDWTPSIHMPRWASRILLEVVGVRVERLQDISEDDAIAEGCQWDEDDNHEVDPVSMYRELWEQINGAGSWDANPWVWVVEFRRMEQGKTIGEG